MSEHLRLRQDTTSARACSTNQSAGHLTPPIVTAPIRAAVKDKQERRAAVTAPVGTMSTVDPTGQQLLDKLFNSFDRNGDGELDFKEVAYMLKQLDPQHSLRSARNAALEALLMCDADADRRLSKAEFQRLLSRIFEVADISFQEGAQKLLDAVSKNKLQLSPSDVSTDQLLHRDMQAAAAAGGSLHIDQQQQQGPHQGALHHSSSSTPSSHAAAAADAVQAQKLTALFGLWDANGDGYVSFEELCQGLAKFKPLKTKQDITATFTEAARVLRDYDDAGDHRLCPSEFATYIRAFMAEAGHDFNDVVDHLVVVASRPSDNPKLQRALDKSATSIQQLLGTTT